MKTVRLFAGIFLLVAICACGNRKQDSQNPTLATEKAVEVVKEQKTVFYDMTLDEALEKAGAEGKYVFIDFHIDGCGPCKKMEETVFPNPVCGEFMNRHFVPIMIDAGDDGAGTELAERHNVFIFPSYLILSPDGFKEGEIQGAELDVDKFLEMLKTVIHAD